MACFLDILRILRFLFLFLRQYFVPCLITAPYIVIFRASFPWFSLQCRFIIRSASCRYFPHCLIASLYDTSPEIASRGIRRIPLLLLFLIGAASAPPPHRHPFPSATRLRSLDRPVRQPRLSDHTFVLQQWCINLHLRVYCLLGSPPPSAKPQP